MTIKELKKYFLEKSAEAHKEEIKEPPQESYLRGMYAGNEIAFASAARLLDLLDEKS